MSTKAPILGRLDSSWAICAMGPRALSGGMASKAMWEQAEIRDVKNDSHIHRKREREIYIYIYMYTHIPTDVLHMY